jgi:type VI secretion system secreted protein VgrG
VHEFTTERRVREGGVLQRGFDYIHPKFTPVADKRGGSYESGFDASALRTYDHDRILEPTTVTQRVADQRLEELRADATTSRGASSARRLCPGFLFEVSDHTNTAHNGSFAVVEVRHDGGDPNATNLKSSARTRAEEPQLHGSFVYENTFRCIPASVPARPRRPKRRLLQVTETAVVVGPPGEEIHTDEHGRIKIQFHWDLEGKLDDKSSCWVRVMQPWAGTSWGSQFIPRVGMEVVVSFTGGDPDRPIVTGTVYNGAAPMPFKLPQDKTRSGLRTRSTPGGAGYNELSFEDAAGHEQIYLHAERDFDEVVEHDHTRTVYGHEVVKVKESRLLDVKNDNVRVVRGNEVLIVEQNVVRNVAGHELHQVGRPPTDEEKQQPRALPEGASAYARFSALASLPMFDDAAAARAGQVRRSKLILFGEDLDGDAYRAGQKLIGRADDLSRKVDAVAGATHLLTNDILTLPDRIREAGGSLDQLDDAVARSARILTNASDVETQITATIDQNREAIGPIANMQRALVEQIRTSCSLEKEVEAAVEMRPSRRASVRRSSSATT